MKPTLESRDQWDADIVSMALRTGGTIPAALFVREMKRAIATEREACAQICDDKVNAEYATGKVDHNEMGWTQACAIAIRARGQE